MTHGQQSPIFLQLDPAAPGPLYQQLVEAVTRAIAAGAARPGDPLPPVRELAEELRINLNTISRAYQKLQDRGLVELRRGVGIFVAVGAGPVSPAGRMQLLDRQLESLVREARELGLEVEPVLDEVRRRFGAGSER